MKELKELKRLTPVKAIRSKCLECVVGNMAEVRRCHLKDCALWPYRMGKRPAVSPACEATSPT